MDAPEAPNAASADENPEAAVALLYRVLLGREPDPEGLRHHSDALRANRATPRQLALAFTRSAEFLGAPALSATLQVVRAMDCDFLLPGGSPVAAELASPEGYEPWVLPYFLEQCRPGMTVLDVGASWGAFALPAGRRVGPSGRVFAAEVSASNCRVLMRSARASGLNNVTVLPFGLSDRLGPELLRRQDFTNNNAIQTDLDAGEADIDDFDIVPVVPLDLVRGALGRVHVVKMDVEGMEYRVSIGALAFLREHRPLVFCEYSPAFQRAGSGVDGGDLLGLYLDLGYGVEILHRHAPREMVSAPGRGALIQQVDDAWRAHVERDQGTHLDLCLHPFAAGGRAAG
jgi:FkbM family methyltransferase